MYIGPIENANRLNSKANEFAVLLVTEVEKLVNDLLQSH